MHYRYKLAEKKITEKPGRYVELLDAVWLQLKFELIFDLYNKADIDNKRNFYFL